MSAFYTTSRVTNLARFVWDRRFRATYPVRPRYYPASVAVEVTTRCNLRCTRCERRVVPPQELNHDTSMAVVEGVLPILRYANSVTLVGGLGEPFMNKRFWDIHRAVASTGARVTFITNGLLMTDEHIERCLDERTHSIFFSVDSTDSAIYERLKLGTNTDHVWGVIARLIEARRRRGRHQPEIVINYAFQTDTIDGMPDMIALARKVGVDRIWFTGVITHDAENVPYSFFNMDLDAVKRKLAAAQRKADEAGMRIRLPRTDPFDRPAVCCHPFDEMFVFYQGDVVACPHFRAPRTYYFHVDGGRVVQRKVDYPHLVMGNVLRENVLDIWNNADYVRLRRWCKEHNADPAMAPCNTCYYAHGWH